jgi:hypothetical protein
MCNGPFRKSIHSGVKVSSHYQREVGSIDGMCNKP